MNEESNVELDEIYKVTSGEARIGLAANNQAQVCVLQRNFSRRQELCKFTLVLGLPTQLGEHRKVNLRVVDSDHPEIYSS